MRKDEINSIFKELGIGCSKASDHAWGVMDSVAALVISTMFIAAL
jgi:hypothetical protein